MKDFLDDICLKFQIDPMFAKAITLHGGPYTFIDSVLIADNKGCVPLRSSAMAMSIMDAFVRVVPVAGTVHVSPSGAVVASFKIGLDKPTLSAIEDSYKSTKVTSKVLKNKDSGGSSDEEKYERKRSDKATHQHYRMVLLAAMRWLRRSLDTGYFNTIREDALNVATALAVLVGEVMTVLEAAGKGYLPEAPVIRKDAIKTLNTSNSTKGKNADAAIALMKEDGPAFLKLWQGSEDVRALYTLVCNNGYAQIKINAATANERLKAEEAAVAKRGKRLGDQGAGTSSGQQSVVAQAAAGGARELRHGKDGKAGKAGKAGVN